MGGRAGARFSHDPRGTRKEQEGGTGYRGVARPGANGVSATEGKCSRSAAFAADSATIATWAGNGARLVGVLRKTLRRHQPIARRNASLLSARFETRRTRHNPRSVP